MRIGKTKTKGYKIRTKLLWMLLTPLLSLLFLGIYTFYEEYKHYRTSLESSKVIGISMKISDLVHALQKERGLSAGYMASDSMKYEEVLNRNRESTDDKLQMLIQTFAANAPTAGFDSLRPERKAPRAEPGHALHASRHTNCNTYVAGNS